MRLVKAGPVPKPGKKAPVSVAPVPDDGLLPGESLGPVINPDGSPTDVTVEMLTGRRSSAAAPTRKRNTPQPCTCGCGGTTKGGRFIPGHDAKYHAAQKRAALGAQAFGR